jgi:pyruvate kinase
LRSGLANGPKRERALKKTKILCTIGPASLSEQTLAMMYETGMNAARINTAYGDIDQYEDVITKVRKVGDIPILLDLKGPELRIHVSGPISLKKGDILTMGEAKGATFTHPVYDQLKVGDRVLFDDAKIQTEVVGSDRETLSLLVRSGGLLEDGKSVNCPGRRFDVPTLTERDMRLVEFAKGQEVEFVCLSFTRDDDDIANLKREIGNSGIGVISKIENSQGVAAFDRILSAADGVMVARGDLGIEVDQERVPLLQKRMIAASNQVGKIVITATEMLESMSKDIRPTRAEVSDVANAILDGTDVVMLSGETAIGKHPVEAVATMSKIALVTEDAVACKVEKEEYQNISSAISWSVAEIARSMPLDKVVTITRTGYTARAIARFKLKQEIIAVTKDPLVKRKLELAYGVSPVHLQYHDDDDRILSAAQALYAMKMVNEQDIVLFTAAFRTSTRHSSNLIEIHTIRELIEFTGHPAPLRTTESKNLQTPME